MIPVIDLEDFSSEAGAEEGRRDRARELLLEACEVWGCFRVVNHWIPAELLREMKGVVGSLLDLPVEIKRRNADVIAGSGYTGPTEDNPLYEALGLYDLGSTTAVDDFCNQLQATSQQREVIKSYAREINGLAMDVACKIAESMGLPSGDLFKEWPSQFRINKYSFTEETVGCSGVCIHTDSGFLTVLQEDDSVGGLEVIDKAGGFVAVDPIPGSLLFNLGDVAKAWSNGRLHNVKHRVQCKAAKTRVSIAMFLLGPRGEALIEPPPALLDSNHPRIYQPFTYEDYRKLRLSSRSRAGEALSLYTAPQAPTVA